MRIGLLGLFLLGLFALKAGASGVEIVAGGLSASDQLSFELRWDHAWNWEGAAAPNNHDAVWIFAKVETSQGVWQHIEVSELSADHQSFSQFLQIEAFADRMGVIVSPVQGFTGEVSPTQLTLKLAQPLVAGARRIRLFAVEMVWVPEDSFWLGDGQSNHAFCAPDSLSPIQIQSEASIPMDSLLSLDELPPQGDIPAEWPKGFDGFYCMKYEISQGQYADFLNCLSASQQQARCMADPTDPPGTPAFETTGTHRNGIRIRQSGSFPSQPAIFALDGDEDGLFDENEDGKDRACNFLQWEDVCAWLAWAGLRPLTEFEYEKACRGPQPPLALEFAWGTVDIIDANTVQLDGLPGETVAEIPSAGQGLASHGYAGPQGALRCGFAARDSSDRLRSGSSYYGIMELSGNLWEQCVSVSVEGLAFKPVPGQGDLGLAGQVPLSEWPSPSGAIYRGGGWNSGILPGFRDLAVSDRFYTGNAPNLRLPTTGGRGGR